MQRVHAWRQEARNQQAPEAQAAHERREQKPERHGRRADDQGELLEPDDLVNQRRAAARGEQREQRRDRVVAAADLPRRYA